MKISSQTFKDMFAKKRGSAQDPLNPHKHWIILLYVFFVMVACLILFSLYILYEIKNDQIFQVTPAPKAVTGGLNQNLLDKVKASFDVKATKEDSLKANPPKYSDPS